MTDILNTVLANLLMVGVFLIPLVLMRMADVILGVAIAKKNNISWHWNKFLWGLFYTVCFIVGTGLFTTSISMIEPIIRQFGIVADEATLTALNGISIVAVCLIILAITVTSYGKDCFEKIKTLAGKSEKIDTINSVITTSEK